MIIGIDLGTTNSAVAVWQDGEAVLVPNSLGDLLTPSAVSLADDGAVMVGMAARERQSSHPKLTATAFKRFMGAERKYSLGRQTFTPEDLSALVLRTLKADAEAWLGEVVEGAVITVPAYFNDRQRKATRRAGELAGLKIERLINEPTAAALAYGLHTLEEENPFLVFDLGGGTFDVSLVQIFDGVIEVRASSGDNQLGGEDFNEALARLARGRMGAALGSAADDPEGFGQVMRAAAERTRRQLTDRESAAFSVVWRGEGFETEITAADFETACADLLARLREPVLRAMRDGKTRVEGLSEIVLVGGATRMPIVRRAVTRMFGRFPNVTIHPDHAVALGAAVQAGLMARDAALDEIRLTDVCPFTLGVDSAETDGRGKILRHVFSPIIERNTVVPASRVRTFYTLADDQRRVVFSILQGESRDPSLNIKLGDLDIPVSPKPAGEVRVDCRFSYDASGLLEVDITVPDTGVNRQMVIIDDDRSGGRDDLAARRQALEALKVHPRDQAANAASLARAERCYEGLLAERREHVGDLIGQFQSVLDGQDPREIEVARKALDARLDEIEGERFL
jgi:molecular chaperone HscC